MKTFLDESVFYLAKIGRQNTMANNGLAKIGLAKVGHDRLKEREVEGEGGGGGGMVNPPSPLMKPQRPPLTLAAATAT